MTFALHTPPLAPTSPSYTMVANFQTLFDALTAPKNTEAEALLTSWGWVATNNPAPQWRLFWRAIEAVRGL